MANVYISEYQSLAIDLTGRHCAAGEEPAIASQKIAIGGSSAQSAAFDDTTKIARIHADEVCSIVFGADPTATSAGARLAAGQTEYFGVKPGHKVAVITNS